MADIFQVPRMCPLKPVLQYVTLPSDSNFIPHGGQHPAYNTKHHDTNFFYDTIKHYEDKVGYCQPFQQSDTILLGFFAIDSIGSYSARLLNADGTVYPHKTISLSDAGDYNGQAWFTTTIKLYDVPEGKYFIQLRYNSSGYTHLLFEPIHVKQIHTNTILWKYYNSYNDQSMIYPDSSWIFQLRTRGYITEITSDAKINTYEDQPLNLEFISGIAFRHLEVTLDRIPEWMADKLNRITMVTDLSVDGIAVTRPEGSKLEPKKNEGVPRSGYTLKLRESVNVNTLDVNFAGIQVGDMPQTNHFYIEDMTIDGSTYNVRRGFNGKRNFLDYLNSTHLTTDGYWTEDSENKLAFTLYAGQAVGSMSLTSANTLKYGLRFDVIGGGNFVIDITGTSTSYAARFGDGLTEINKSTLNGTVAINRTYTNTYDNTAYIYFLNGTELVDNACTITIKSISGDLPPAFSVFTMNLGNGITSIGNNLFRYVTDLSYFDIDNQELGTYDIDNMLRWLYDSRANLGAGCEVYLRQTPAAPPTRDLLQFKAVISSLISSILTD